MWDGLFVLLLLCIVMASASFLAGYVPLYISLSSNRRRLIAALGSGVLVGTALIVIIPEGVETLYSIQGSSHSHDRRAASYLDRRDADLRVFPGALKHDTWRREPYAAVNSLNIAIADNVSGVARSENKDAVVRQAEKDDQRTDEELGNEELEDEQDEHRHDGAARNPHAWVGLSLISGFILMYLIDTVPRHVNTSSQPQRFHISLPQFSFNRTPSVSNEVPPTPTTDIHSGPSAPRPSSTTIGLVIHSAADGIALGASSTTTSRLSFIIFLAIMIHKAPAAFGLTSVLLKQGLSKRAARAHLVVFSLAAPLGALVTWAAAHLLGYSSLVSGSSDNTEFATGVLLIFSGGTFLYVAMHTMQEEGQAHDEPQTNGYAGLPMDIYDQAAPTKKEGPVITDTLMCVAGMLLPLLTQFGHVH